ncbi:hypothetical protein GPECTOR_48g444 [Gonium pectorale]|uniref:Uncharacterized protein n=1 Tax=Gonium pectorale TaxID=33097 RepID=A0A150G841_GONPE|nr:hypothetical protein GPECTOR_48g444 [Gonium pectorale]|eukprot:KXZ46012.1 hypothetical protein GPECTOR_48g444 [Gonium pectorale]
MDQLRQLLAELGADVESRTGAPQSPVLPAAAATTANVVSPPRIGPQRRLSLLHRLHAGLSDGRLAAGSLTEQGLLPGLLTFLRSELDTATAAAVAAPTAGPLGSPSAFRPLSPPRGSSMGVEAGVVLECVGRLLSEPLPVPLQVQLLPLLGSALDVLRAAAARVPPAAAALSLPTAAATSSPSAAPLYAVSAAAVTGAGSDSRLGWLFGASAGGAAAELSRSGGLHRIGGGDGTAAGAGWSADVSAAFFAASLLVRAAGHPRLAAAALAGGGPAALVPLLTAAPPMLVQMAVFASYKLLRAPLALSAVPMTAEADADEAAAAVPSAAARTGQVGSLVRLLGSPSAPPVSRMYGLLALARLANHSSECQMDAVREGALPPLLRLVSTGCEEEAVHGCRLMAILAQATPTHGRFGELGVVSCLLPLLRLSRGPAAAEHAASVVAVLSQNPDTHFGLVGAGAVPALVPLLTRGSPKCRTYVLAALMLVADGEERHAAVVVRAGALPSLVRLAAIGGVAGTMSHGRGGGGRGGSGRSSPAKDVTAAGSPTAAGAASGGGNSASDQEFAAAVLCSLARYVDVQAELAACGAVPALIRCLGRAGPEAATHAAEALVHCAAGCSETKRDIAADPWVRPALLRLLTGPAGAPGGAGGPGLTHGSAPTPVPAARQQAAPPARPSGRYWGLQLLRAISTDDEALDVLLLGAAGGAAAAPVVLPGGGGGDSSGSAGGGDVGGLVAAAATARSREVSSRGTELVEALVRMLAWGAAPASAGPAGVTAAASGSSAAAEEPSWQAGRCRVLAAWLLARLCDVSYMAPHVVASTAAVRQLMLMLAEEQRAVEASAAAAAAAAEAADVDTVTPPPAPPLLPGELLPPGATGSGTTFWSALAGAGAGAPLDGSSAGDTVPAAARSGSSGGHSHAGFGSAARRSRFDANAAAAAEAALLCVWRQGAQGQLAVGAELALAQWMGLGVRLSVPLE